MCIFVQVYDMYIIYNINRFKKDVLENPWAPKEDNRQSI